MTGRDSLSTSEWRQFVAEDWTRRPRRLSSSSLGPLCSTATAFRSLIRANGARARGETSPDFYIDNTQVIGGADSYLPALRDRTIEQYAERVGAALGARRFGIILPDFHALDLAVFLRMLRFVEGLFRLTGLPGDHCGSTLFFGNYSKTPLGVHAGRAENFMFVIAGRKRLRFWPPEYFRGKEASILHKMDYDPWMKDSIVLEGGPGDVLYWPDSYWHIGEDAGELSMAVTIHAFMDGDRHSDVMLATQQLMEQSGAERRQGPYRFVSEGWPDEQSIRFTVQERLRDYRKLQIESNLERQLTARWMNHVTALGFAPIPEPLPVSRLRGRDVIRGRPERPVLCVAWTKGETLCSANGHAFVVQAGRGVKELIREATSGSAVTVAEIVRKYKGRLGRGFGESDIRDVLEKLRSLRAIRTRSS